MLVDLLLCDVSTAMDWGSLTAAFVGFDGARMLQISRSWLIIWSFVWRYVDRAVLTWLLFSKCSPVNSCFAQPHPKLPA